MPRSQPLRGTNDYRDAVGVLFGIKLIMSGWALTVTNHFNVFMAAGFEHNDETGDNNLLAWLGGEYTIYVSDDQQTLLLPGGFLDNGGGEFTFSLQLSIGYTW